MPVKVRCPECDKALNVPDAARGKAVKCPACQARIPVPAESAAKKPSKAKARKEQDSSDFLANLDLKSVEDHRSRVCPKCGSDVTEDDIECPVCGIDLATGGLGVAARKKLLKGPDPDQFYATIWKDGWRFVGRNQAMAWRTMMYTLVSALFFLGAAFLYLYISPVPPRVFFAGFAIVSVMVIPGWLSCLNAAVIDMSLEKKDKFKRFPFDFFLASALGMKFLVWNVIFGLPVIALPAAIGYVMTEFGGMPEYVLYIGVGIGYLILLSMLPIAMSHLAMPIDLPGWLFWKVVPAWALLLKPVIVWTTLFLATNLLTIAGFAVVGALYGNTLASFVQTMESNAAVNRHNLALERMSATDKQKLESQEPKKLAPVDYTVLIAPAAIFLASLLPIGFTMLFNIRTNGQFAYYFRDTMGLVGQAKQKKYKAILPRGEEADDEKPKTLPQVLVEAAVIVLICALLGGIGGMLYGAISGSQMGIMATILIGVYYGTLFADMSGHFNMVSAAFTQGTGWGLIVLLVPFGNIFFTVNYWNEARSGCLTQVIASIVLMFLLILAVAGLISGILPVGDGTSGAPTNAAPAETGMDPAMMGADPAAAPAAGGDGSPP